MFSDLKTAAFEVCLQRVLAGESIEQAVAEYPAWAEEFNPMLKAALAAREYQFTPVVPRAAIARSRAHFLRAARQQAEQKPAGGLFPALPALRFAMAAFVIILIVIFTGAVTAVLAAQSLPGELLYNLKIAGEQTQLRLTKDPVRRLELQESFDHKRLEEVDRLIEQERSIPVSFVGALHEMGANTWRVGEVTVRLDPQTSLEGDLQTGLNVGVEGTLQQDGSVHATRIWDRAFVFTGELMGFTGDIWQVSGVDILILPQTRIEGQPAIGSRLEMLIVQMADENWAAKVVNVVSRGAKPPTATQIPVIKPSPTPPAPSATEIEQPQPSSTPNPTRTPRPTATPEPEGDDKDQPSLTPENTRTPKPTGTPEPTDDDGDDGGDDDDHDPSATPTGLASPTSSPTPTPTRTLKPTKTPEEDDDD
jgi:hypothetical protein